MAGRTIIRTIAAILLWCALPFAAEAHLMPPQRGTINIVNDSAFVVLSIPVSAFKGIDDNNDGRLSVTELSAHYTEIETAISQRLQLSDDRGPRPMLGLMLKLSPDDDTPGAPAPQLVMLGRFGLDGADRPLRLKIDLFGIDKSTRTPSIRATRRGEAQVLVFSPDKPSLALFAPAYAVFGDYVQIGAEHILLGFDHLIFLLVILACGWSWRQVVAALTCFTLGHCITLAASVWGILNISSAFVEPAIAATVVMMAIFDWRTRSRAAPAWLYGRLALVFACALIHGLGLGATLVELGLDNNHRITSLAGFNVGVEIGQLAFALAAAALMAGVNFVIGSAGIYMAMRTASLAGVTLGGIWFVQRIVVLM